MLRHWNPDYTKPKPMVKWKDLLTSQWKGPDVLLTSGRGYACIFPQDADSPLWVPDRLIRHVRFTTPTSISFDKSPSLQKRNYIVEPNKGNTSAEI